MTSLLHEMAENHDSGASLASSFVPIENNQEAIQLIDENKTFNEDVLDHIINVQLNLSGVEHRIVSVFGSQSTGKSTLLNFLFNTNFGVMDETCRQQTTKGIWLAVSHGVSTTISKNGSTDDHNIVVMDVEGTDGTERGEDQDFERKAALFAMSTSEVLIVNLWETQVGWYQGANMGLMKTVFEVNLSLFGRAKLNPTSDHKVLLLFVIRDYTGVTSKESLSVTLTRDLLRIWDSLNKPADMAHLPFDDFFDLAFHTLSHKIYQKEQFLQDVRRLGNRLVDKSADDFLFKPNYCHNIPIEGWTMYAESCWDQIESNKDLDLPTQQIMVARCKCEELATLCFKEFEVAFVNLQKKAHATDSSSSPLDYEKIGADLAAAKQSALAEYDNFASKYNNEVYEQRRVLLLEKLVSKLSSVVQIYADQLTVTKAQEYLVSLNKRGKSVKLLEAIQTIKEAVLASYAEDLGHLSIDGEIPNAAFSERLQSELLKVDAQEKIEEVSSIANKFLRKLSAVLSGYVQSEVSRASDLTWDNIKEEFEKQKKALLQKFETEDGDYDFGIGVEPQVTAAALDTMEFKSWDTLNVVIAKYTSKDYLYRVLKDRFDERFGYDSNGNPRVYQTSKELETSFALSKNYALEALPTLARAQLSDETDFEPSVDLFSSFLRRKYDSVQTALKMEDAVHESDSDSDDETKRRFAIVITESTQEDVLLHFKRDADAIFVARKAAIVQSKTQIPYYIYLVILVLGWNEVLAVIRSPFFFSLFIILGAITYGMYQTSLLGPAVTVGQRVLEESVCMGKRKIREFVFDDHELHARNAQKMSIDNELDDLSEPKDLNELRSAE